MINDQEIEQKAHEFGIHPAHVEKDYVYGWLLKGIYSESSLGERLILKGGNALRKAYLANTRFSKDLDFSVQESISENFLLEELNKICLFVTNRTGIQFDLTRTLVQPKNVPNIDREVIEARAYFKGFCGEENIVLKTQLDVTQFDRIYLPVQSRKLLHLYSDYEACAAILKCQKAEEILASKLNTLLQRRRVSDLFDLLFSILFNNDFDINRHEVITTFLKKTVYEENPVAAKQLLLEVHLEEFKPFWNTIVVPAISFFRFDEVITRFAELVNVLFGLIPAVAVSPSPSRFSGGYSGYVPFNYFPSDTRNTIIAAGRVQTLIELIYDGYRRFVEPYSFEYRIRKKDGRGVEYFWGYDTSGGKSGHVGIKMFICDKIQSVAETNKFFSAKYPIEL